MMKSPEFCISVYPNIKVVTANQNLNAPNEKNVSQPKLVICGCRGGGSSEPVKPPPIEIYKLGILITN